LTWIVTKHILFGGEGATMKILIIDDSGVMRRIHMNALREHKVDDADMLEAEDGAKALQMAQSEQIDLFLVDWNMPRLNGLQLVQTLRTMEQYRETPIIMITSEAAKYNVVEAIKVGVTNYLVKPVRAKQIWEKIGKYFEGMSGS
jgi:two-component system, chemotaxis family, chemotaxis protein CheY